MIVAGFGFRSGVQTSALRAALALAQQGHPAVSALATLCDKAPELAGLAETLGLPLIAIESVAGIATPTQSPASLATRGTGSVAEAVALAAAGPGARLLSRRILSPDRSATCAIAQGATP